MSYVTPAQLRQILSPSATPGTDTSSPASMSDAELQEAIDEAETEVDSRLSARYTVPFTDVPVIVEKLTRDIAAWLATLVFRRGDPIDARDPVQLRYERAEGLLASVQAGKTELPVDPGGPLPEASADAEVINQYDGDLFTLCDFNLGPTPFRYPAIMPGYDDSL